MARGKKVAFGVGVPYLVFIAYRRLEVCGSRLLRPRAESVDGTGGKTGKGIPHIVYGKEGGRWRLII